MIYDARKHFIIQNCQIEGMLGYGIAIANLIRGTIKIINNQIRDNQLAGIRFDGSSSILIIQGDFYLPHIHGGFFYDYLLTHGYLYGFATTYVGFLSSRTVSTYPP
ncbi:MAG: right-handed parallel beta-helix repeat-containing protein [Candidatus Hodarchaeota archaeon]